MKLTYKHKDGGIRPVFVEGKQKVPDRDGARAARTALGRDRLAKETGVSPGTVNNWVEGQRPISLPCILLIHHFFKEKEIVAPPENNS